MLPSHAPPAYADRNTLWNVAEAAEKQWNSQLARECQSRSAGSAGGSTDREQALCIGYPLSFLRL